MYSPDLIKQALLQKLAATGPVRTPGYYLSPHERAKVRVGDTPRVKQLARRRAIRMGELAPPPKPVPMQGQQGLKHIQEMQRRVNSNVRLGRKPMQGIPSNLQHFLSVPKAPKRASTGILRRLGRKLITRGKG